MHGTIADGTRTVAPELVVRSPWPAEAVPGGPVLPEDLPQERPKTGRDLEVPGGPGVGVDHGGRAVTCPGPRPAGPSADPGSGQLTVTAGLPAAVVSVTGPKVAEK